MITQAEAKRRIYDEWARWTRNNPKVSYSGTDGFSFFGYLTQERPSLLRFRCRGDKWQTVHGWLLRRRLVSD